jgi:hypothetical protein
MSERVALTSLPYGLMRISLHQTIVPTISSNPRVIARGFISGR